MTRHAVHRRLAALAAMAAVALLAAAPSGATLRAVEDSAEMPLARVVLPAETGGSLTVRKCATCKAVVVTVTEQTPCTVRPSRKPVPLRELLRVARTPPANSRPYLYVYYNPATRQATRLVLDPIPAR
jgi:hypothetical protein